MVVAVWEKIVWSWNHIFITVTLGCICHIFAGNKQVAILLERPSYLYVYMYRWPFVLKYVYLFRWLACCRRLFNIICICSTPTYPNFNLYCNYPDQTLVKVFGLVCIIWYDHQFQQVQYAQTLGQDDILDYQDVREQVANLGISCTTFHYLYILVSNDFLIRQCICSFYTNIIYLVRFKLYITVEICTHI